MDVYFDPSKRRIGELFRRVIGQEILGAQFVADLFKGSVELGFGGGVEVAASGVLGELDQGVFAAGVASGAGFDGDDDDAVDDGFGLLGFADGVFVTNRAYRIATVGDDNDHFPSLTFF